MRSALEIELGNILYLFVSFYICTIIFDLLISCMCMFYDLNVQLREYFFEY